MKRDVTDHEVVEISCLGETETSLAARLSFIARFEPGVEPTLPDSSETEPT